MQLSFLGMELMSFSLFAICSWHALKVVRSKQRLLELVVAVVFGVLLEELNVLLSGGFYAYGTDFLIIFDQAPLAIGLGWAVIIYSAMYISNAYGLDERVKPFFDAIQAILIDLSMDAVAIRLGFWRWPIALTDGWFGVPAANFFGWMLVVAIYSGVTRLVRHMVERKKDRRYLLLQVVSPPICYGILYSFLILYVTVAYSVFAVEVQRFIIFAVELTIFSFIVLASIMRRRFQDPSTRRTTRFVHSTRLPFCVPCSTTRHRYVRPDSSHDPDGNYLACGRTRLTHVPRLQVR